MDNSKNSNINITDLFVSYFIGEINPVELRILEKWIAENPSNKAQFEKFEAVWLLSNKTNDASKIDNDQLWNQLHARMKETSHLPQEEKVNRSRSLRILKVAASWLVLMALGSALTLWFTGKNVTGKNQITEITAPLGAKSFVKLPDGTSVWLNAGSKLSYNNDFNLTERKINLTGEAFFSVSTDKSKPFTVNTSDIIVRAFGTRFNVKAYPEEKTITTTLEEGKIDVTLINTAKSNSTPVVLRPNQKIVFYKTSNTFRETDTSNPQTGKAPEKTSPIDPLPSKMVLASNVNTELYTSWKEKRWIIEGVTFESLVPMLERRFNMKIRFQDEELKNYKFTGTVQNETIEQIMEALRFTAPMDFKIKRDSITLSVNPLLKSRYKKIITTKKQ